MHVTPYHLPQLPACLEIYISSFNSPLSTWTYQRQVQFSPSSCKKWTHIVQFSTLHMNVNSTTCYLSSFFFFFLKFLLFLRMERAQIFTWVQLSHAELKKQNKTTTKRKGKKKNKGGRERERAIIVKWFQFSTISNDGKKMTRNSCLFLNFPNYHKNGKNTKYFNTWNLFSPVLGWAQFVSSCPFSTISECYNVLKWAPIVNLNSISVSWN